MSKKLTAAFAAGAAIVGVAAIDTPADAADKGNWYTNLRLGAIFTDAIEPKAQGPILSSPSLAAAVNASSIELKTGFAGSLAIGYDFGKYRAEGEFLYSRAATDNINAFGVALKLDGYAQTLNMNVNGYYDFETSHPITPYIGAGIGITYIDYQADLAVVTALGGPGVEVAEANDWAFNVQGMGGLRYAFTDRTSISLEYRLQGLLGVDVKANIPGGGGSIGLGEDNVFNHIVTVGAEYTF